MRVAGDKTYAEQCAEFRTALTVGFPWVEVLARLSATFDAGQPGAPCEGRPYTHATT